MALIPNVYEGLRTILQKRQILKCLKSQKKICLYLKKLFIFSLAY